METSSSVTVPNERKSPGGSRSLVSQISFMVLAGVVITAMVVTGIYTGVASNRLETEIERRHRVLSQELAIIIETAWRQDNYPSMVQVLDSLLSDGDITLARIIDNDGYVVVSSDAQRTGIQVSQASQKSDLTVPISDLGLLELHISNKSQNTFLIGMLWQGILATYIVTGVVIAAVRRRLIEITQDLDETVKAAETMREGLFELGLNQSKHAEIDSLRTSLNETGLRLRQLTTDLQRQVERAEMASESKGMFLANMSHEIRTPLNGMIGMIDMLETEYMSSEQQDYVETLRGSSQALLSLLNDILDFSRIEAGRLSLNIESVHGAEIVEEVVSLMTPLAEEKGIRLQCTYRQRIPSKIKADSGRLRQILSNIIGNAVKFTPSGWIDVAMGTDNGALRIDVIDTGIGIPEDQLNSIFQAFEQVDGTSKRQYGGTGLGLSISKHLSTLMGGELSAAHHEIGGTIFTLTLPCCEESRELIPNYFADKDIAWFSNRDHPEVHLAQNMEVLGARIHRIHSADELSRKRYDLVCLFDEKSLEQHAWFEHNQQVCYIGPRPNTPILTDESFAIHSFPIHWKRLAEEDIPQLDRPKQPTQKPQRKQSNVDLEGLAAEIFVVEDNKVNQRVICAILKKLHCRVTLANNGQEAVDKLQSGYVPDVILMDCQMPVLDGYSATRAIRELERSEGGARQTIIAITANAMIGDKEKCLAAGMDDHLPKPITVASLGVALNKHQIITWEADR